jgi:hypothetical protein
VRGPSKPEGILMEADTCPAEGSQWAANKREPGVRATAARPPKIHHLIFYGQASRDDVAAFAATKIFLESTIYPRETDGGASKSGTKAGLDERHYVVRFPTKSQIEITVHLAPKQSGNGPTAVRCTGRPGRSSLDFTVINRGIILCIRALSAGAQ